MTENGKSITAKKLLIISTGNHTALMSKVEAFLEREGYQCLTIAGDEKNDPWKIRKKVAACDRVLVFVTGGPSENRQPLHLLNSTPEHLLSIFPIQLDGAPIPDCISHCQFISLKSSDADLEKLQPVVLDWLNDGIEAFQKEQSKVNRRLRPRSFSGRLDDLQKIPRPASMERIVAEIEKWDRDDSSRFFAVEGGAASGKSRIAAQLLLEQGDRIAAAHFINSSDSPEDIIRDLAAQLAANLAQYRQTLVNELRKETGSLDAGSLFNVLILSPLRRENPNRHFWLLLDGIDKLNDEYHKNQLLEMLLQNQSQLPEWLKIIVTYRPDPNIELLLGNAAGTCALAAPCAGEESYLREDSPAVPEDASGSDEESAASTGEDAERLPIFISYGHDAHTDKVVAICDALRKRGHKVWIDRQGIPLGSDWRRKIYDGIRHSQLFLAFLSDHSVKSEYCRTEIRIAIGAPEHLMPTLPVQLEETNIPSQLRNFRRVDLRDWPSAADRADFQQAMTSLEDWIDDERHVEFCKEMDELNRRLEPFSFEARLGELLNSPFVGREWLLKIIDKWDKGPSRLFGIVGGPGFGKSVFVANLRALQPEKVVAAQFIEWNMPSIFSARRIIQSLAFQLAARLETYRTALLAALQSIVDLELLEEDELFEKLLTLPLKNVDSTETRWIIIDALDEATGRDGRNPFVSTLVRNLDQLPDWLKIIVTTRPDNAVAGLLEQYHLERFDTAEISKYQREDMLEYIYTELKALVPGAADSGREGVAAALAEAGFTGKILDMLIDKSQNMFLYLRIACSDIVSGNRRAQDIDKLPSGINSIFAQYFNRQYSGPQQDFFLKKLRPLLEMGAACQETITVELLHDAAAANDLGFSFDEAESALRTLGSLAEIRSNDDGYHVFQFIHRMLWEWLSSLPPGTGYRIDNRAGHGMLARFSLSRINAASAPFDPSSAYALHYAVRHLIALNDPETLWGVIGGMDPVLFEEQKKRFGNYSPCLEDCARAIAFYRGPGNGPVEMNALPRICRLMVTYRELREKQKGDLKDLLRPDTDLKSALRIMAQIDDAKAYYLAGCWLLERAAKHGLDVEPLIASMEQKCSGQLSSIKTSVYPDDPDIPFDQSDQAMYLPRNVGYAYYHFRNSRVIPYDEAAISYIDYREHEISKNDVDVSYLSVYECLFLGYGPLGGALPYLTTGQLERVLSIVDEPEACEMILDAMSARSCSRQVAGALWYFEKLRHYAGRQFGPPEQGEGEDFDSEYLDLVNELFFYEARVYGPFAAKNRGGLSPEGELKDVVIELTSEEEDASFIFGATELIFQRGLQNEALEFLLAHSGNCERVPLGLAAELYKYGKYDEAYSVVEKHILPPEKSILSIIRSNVSVFGLSSAMCEAGMWEDLRKLVLDAGGGDSPEMTVPELDRLLVSLMKKEQYALAAEIAEKEFSFKGADEWWCMKVLDAPNLPGIMKSLLGEGLLPERVVKASSGEELQKEWFRRFSRWIRSLESSHADSPEERLCRTIFNSTSLESVAKLVLKEGVPVEIQLEYIDHAFRSFAQRAKSGLKQDDLLEQIREMLGILGENSGELREKLRPYTAAMLNSYIVPLDDRSVASLELFKPSVVYHEDPPQQTPKGPFANMVLFDTYSSDRKQLNKCILNMPAYVSDRFYCLLAEGMIPEAKAFLDELSMKKEEKGKMILVEFANLLAYLWVRKKADSSYQWQVPDSIADMIRLAREYDPEQRYDHVPSTLGVLLRPFGNQADVRQVAAAVMDIWLGMHKGDKFTWELSGGANLFLRHFGPLLSWQQYAEFSGEELKTGHKYGFLEAFVNRLEQVDDWPGDWFEEALGMLNDRGVSNEVRCRLFRLALQRGTDEQIKKVLSPLSAGVLVQSCRDMLPLPPAALYKALHGADWSENAIHRIIATQEWRKLPFEDLNTISPCMLDDESFLKVWLNAMLKKLCDPACTGVTRSVIGNCPEFDLRRETPESDQGGER